MPIAIVLQPLAGPKWSNRKEGLKMAEVLRFGSLVRHFLEVKFLFGLHYAELRCYFAVSEACWRDLANSDET